MAGERGAGLARVGSLAEVAREKLTGGFRVGVMCGGMLGRVLLSGAALPPLFPPAGGRGRWRGLCTPLALLVRHHGVGRSRDPGAWESLFVRFAVLPSIPDTDRHGGTSVPYRTKCC